MWILARMVVVSMLWLAGTPAGAADLAGHGGPVRAMALTADGRELITASFDSTVIRWSLSRSVALQVLRFHKGAVNAVVALPEGRFASAGEDGRIALWLVGGATPAAVLSGHDGPVVALAVSANGAMLASGSWDQTAALWNLATAKIAARISARSNVNGVGFLPDGRLALAAYDGTLRIVAPNGVGVAQADLGAPLSALAVAPDGEIVVAAADGRLRFLDSAGVVRATLAIAEAPLASLALSRDGRRIAAAGFRGTLALVDRAARKIERTLEGPAFPVWSLALSADGTELLTGGADRMVRRWSVATGEPVSPVGAAVDDGVPARLRNHPGAEVFRACAACHTLSADGGNRAGPSLAGLYGRKIGTAPGYDFSPALRQLDIVWSAETLQKLFELGPATYTPGTKMPEQTLSRAEDRAALADFLGAAQTR